MATRDEIGEALKAADAAGDTAAAAKLADAYANYQPPSIGTDPESAMGATIAAGYKANPEDVASALPRAVEGGKGEGAKLVSTMERLNMAPANPMFPEDTNPLSADQPGRAQAVAQYEKVKPSLGMAGAVGGAVPEMLVSAPLLGMGSSALAATRPLMALGRFAPFAADVGVNAGYAGGKTAVEGGGITDVAKSMGLAGLGAGIGHVAGGFAQSGVRPMVGQKAGTLIDAGLDLTPGQLLGRKASDTEHALGNVAWPIDEGRKSVLKQYSRAETNDILKPFQSDQFPSVSGSTKHVGFDAVDDAVAQARKAYTNDVLPFIEMPHPNAQAVVTDLAGELQKNSLLTSSGGAQRVNQFAQDRLAPYINGGKTMTGEEFKQLESDVSQNIARYRDSPDPDAKHMADGFRELQKQLREKAVGLTPEAKANLQIVNGVYGRLQPLVEASNAAGGKIGEFGPLQVFNKRLQAGYGDEAARPPLTRAAMELIQNSGNPWRTPLKTTAAVASLADLTTGSMVGLAANVGGAAVYSPVLRRALNRGVLPDALDRLPVTPTQLASQAGARAMNRKRDQE